MSSGNAACLFYSGVDEYLVDHFLGRGGEGRVPNQSGWWLIPDGPSPPGTTSRSSQSERLFFFFAPAGVSSPPAGFGRRSLA